MIGWILSDVVFVSLGFTEVSCQDGADTHTEKGGWTVGE